MCVMPTMVEVDERLSVPVSRDTADALRAMAAAEETSVAALVRRALRLLLRDTGPERPQRKS
jgi:hypothetical protein